jgi:leucyl aminopeptidase
MALRIIPSNRLAKADALVLAFFGKQAPAEHPWWSKLPAPVKVTVKKWLSAKDVRMNWGSAHILRPSAGPWPAVLLMGLGERKLWSDRRERLLARRVTRLALEHRWKTLTIGVQRLDASKAQLLAENMAMANYEFQKFRSAPPEGWPSVRQVQVALPKGTPKVANAFRDGLTVGEAINASRDLSNTPGSHMTPSVLAQAALELGKAAGVKVSILDLVQMKKLKMGAILGVAQGSVESPKLIVMEYRGGPSKDKPLAFIGKGVTFDSGGLNLKPSSAIYEMHMDMTGGASVMAAISAIAQLKLPINVVGVVPAVENMPSGSSYRPGDLLTSMSGKVIEVLDTDAEGRIILADGLTYAQKQFNPKMLVDVATLTGAALVALGQRAIALFSNREELETEGRSIGEASGDYAWPLPMWEEYDGDMKGTFGDVANVGKVRWGGAIQGAVFLKNFVDKTPWIHLDIAPTMTAIEGDSLGKGASGTAVRWLVELARRQSNQAK